LNLKKKKRKKGKRAKLKAQRTQSEDKLNAIKRRQGEMTAIQTGLHTEQKEFLKHQASHLESFLSTLDNK
jgi:hypothetical protein